MNTVFNTLYPALLPLLDQVIGLVLASILIWVANIARQKFGIEIEAKHREALQSALMSGIRAALSRGLMGPEAIKAAIEHAMNSTPDAILKLKPEPGVLERIAEAKLREVTSITSVFEDGGIVDGLASQTARALR